MYSSIADSFDLTLECIRRHYSNPSAMNPLGERLAYYDDFFALFRDSDTYVRFFSLDDLVNEARNAVRSLVSGDPLMVFSVPAFAGSSAEYGEYRQRNITFVRARNKRIQQLGLQPSTEAPWSASLAPSTDATHLPTLRSRLDVCGPDHLDRTRIRICQLRAILPMSG